jgi:hypothetical protein
MGGCPGGTELLLRAFFGSPLGGCCLGVRIDAVGFRDIIWLERGNLEWTVPR